MCPGAEVLRPGFVGEPVPVGWVGVGRDRLGEGVDVGVAVVPDGEGTVEDDPPEDDPLRDDPALLRPGAFDPPADPADPSEPAVPPGPCAAASAAVAELGAVGAEAGRCGVRGVGRKGASTGSLPRTARTTATTYVPASATSAQIVRRMRRTRTPLRSTKTGPGAVPRRCRGFIVGEAMGAIVRARAALPGGPHTPQPAKTARRVCVCAARSSARPTSKQSCTTRPAPGRPTVPRWAIGTAFAAQS